MPSIYCPSCGHKNIYSVSRPKFCNSCGESFSSNLSTKSNQQSKANINPENLDEEGSDVTSIPDIVNLDFDVSYEGLAKTYKGSDLVRDQEGQPKTNSNNSERSTRGRKPRRRSK